MKKLLLPLLALGLLAPGTALAKKKGKKNKGPDFDNTVTIAPVMLTWPAVQLEYERRLGKRIGVGGFGSVGKFQPRALVGLVDTALPGFELGGSQSLGARANFFFKDFDRGVYAGLTARWGRVAGQYETTSEEQGVEVTSTVDTAVTNVMAGPHLGYKFTFKFGLTLGLNGGIGYGKYTAKTTASAEGGGESASTDLEDLNRSGVVPFGVMVAGWSF